MDAFSGIISWPAAFLNGMLHITRQFNQYKQIYAAFVLNLILYIYLFIYIQFWLGLSQTDIKSSTLLNTTFYTTWMLSTSCSTEVNMKGRWFQRKFSLNQPQDKYMQDHDFILALIKHYYYFWNQKRRGVLLT